MRSCVFKASFRHSSPITHHPSLRIMANIRVTCPACKSELEIDETFDGQEVECGNCLEVFTAKGPKSSGPGKSGTGKIPGAGTSRSGTSGTGSSRAKSEDKPAKKKRRDDD